MRCRCVLCREESVLSCRTSKRVGPWQWWSVAISALHHSPSYLLLLLLLSGLNLLVLFLLLSWIPTTKVATNSWNFPSFHLPKRTSWLISFQPLRIAFSLSFFLVHFPLMFSFIKTTLPLPKLPCMLDQAMITHR